jgi:pimeloyl-ACP methyl ester carboxylesterase
MQEIPELAGVRHEFLDAAGLRTHVALAGPADAPPVLLVHGWPQNWWAWRHLIPLLATDFNVIAPDLRGHGWTEAPSGGYEKDQLSRDLLGVLDALGIERVTWVGHDWGGWTGFIAASQAAQRLERLLALCIPHPWAAPNPRQLALLGYQLPVSTPLIGPRIAGPLSRAILQTGRRGQRLTTDDLRIFSEHIPGWVSTALYRTFLTKELRSAAHRPNRLEVDTTLLLGELDVVTSGIEAGPVDAQPRLTVEKVPGVAHWLPEQRSELLAERIRQGRG